MALRQPITLTKGLAVVTCGVCGFDWETPLRRGGYPNACADCVPPIRKRKNPTGGLGGAGPVVIEMKAHPGVLHGINPEKADAYLRLLDHVGVRLAVEEALPLLKMGRVRQAIARLEQVPARSRVLDSRTQRSSELRLASRAV